MATNRESAPPGRPLCVSVPDEIRGAFENAQHYVEEYFQGLDQRPEEGTIEVSGERYLLVRAASLSTEFFDLVAGLYADRGPETARQVCNAFLFDIAHAMGRADAQRFTAMTGVTDPIERLSAGPIHFAFAGWAFVDISPESRPSPDDDYYLLYDHPYSFEADSWIRAGTQSDFPVCVMNSGYSSGWCEESFGVSLVATEISCRATGAEHCRFIMAPPWRMYEYLSEAAATGAAPDRRADAAVVPEFFGRKRLQEEHEQYREFLEREVARRTAELTEANTRLRREMAERERSERQLLQAQKMEAVGTLAGGIAHDFNNLLTSILAGVELAGEDLQPGSEAARCLESVQAAAGRAAELTTQLLSLARKRPYEMRATSVNDVVSASARLLARTVPDSVDVRLELDPGLPRCRADAAQLEQALLNLGINARDAMPEGGTLTFSTHLVRLPDPGAPADARGREGQFVVLRAADTGEGIAPDVRERVFEPFFTTKGAGAGSGLGLAMVYDCMRAHDGWAAVESTGPSGTTLGLWFPYQPAVASTDTRPIRLPATGQEHILVVDDADLVLQMARLVLERRGYQVSTAIDGAEAIGLLERAEVEPDLVVTDLSMPRLGGRSLLRELRDRCWSVPVVLMSGYGVAGRRDELRREGFADVLPKPFDSKSLPLVVRKVLDRAKR